MCATGASTPFPSPRWRRSTGRSSSSIRESRFWSARTAAASRRCSRRSILCDMNAEGGSRHARFGTRRSESELPRHLRLIRSGLRPATDFFLRAETFYNVASYVDDEIGTRGYGDVRLHDQSHGESFIALALNRFHPGGLYLLDEPEAAHRCQAPTSGTHLWHRCQRWSRTPLRQRALAAEPARPARPPARARGASEPDRDRNPFADPARRLAPEKPPGVKRPTTRRAGRRRRQVAARCGHVRSQRPGRLSTWLVKKDVQSC
ncbi:MAG: hypothetical protein QOH74_1639 [Gaiellales bacterium]|nr:hypothetical protein [Gaiellales bacterium]